MKTAPAPPATPPADTPSQNNTVTIHLTAEKFDYFLGLAQTATDAGVYVCEDFLADILLRGLESAVGTPGKEK